MASIKAIDHDSVHRIHSGQVVLELQGAIKELVENSLDAGATSIDVRIKDHGLDTIEVADNGSGIAEADWPYIGMKHHTSKLPSLTDLPNITTFGFRGEALGSLCALCESVQVVTATKEAAPMGAIIKLGRDGRVLDSTGRVARPRGTTITLTGLFTPLPVRRKEFERTAKREFTKALNILNAYALVPASVSKEDGRAGVRLKVEAVAAGKAGKRTSLLATDGRGSLRASVGAVWGPKALEGVLDVDLELDVEVDGLMARREGLTEASQMVRLSGLISSGAWGQGRSSPDRQFYYVNGRPCDLKQVGRAVNEVYKSFNTHQVPLAILDFHLPRESVDINVSPDKRTIFLHSEANLIIALRAALEEFFAPSRSAYAVGGASHTVKLVQPTQTQLQLEIPSKGGDETAPDEHAEAESLEQEDQVVQQDQPLSPARSASPISRDGTAEAGPSRPFTRQATPRGADDELVFEGEVDIIPESSSRSSRRQRSAELRAQVTPAESRRLVTQVMDTTTASWSPDRNRKTGRSTTTRSGKEAQVNLRRQLAGYASQSVAPVEVDMESEEGDGIEVDADGEVASSQEESAEAAEAVEEEDDNRAEAAVPDVHLDQGLDPPEESPLETLAAPSRLEDDSLWSGGQSEPTRHSLRDSPTSANGGFSETPVKPPKPASSVSVQRRYRDPVTSTLVGPTSSFRDEISGAAASGELTLGFDLDRLRSRYTQRRTIGTSSRGAKDAYASLQEGGVTSAAGIGNRDAARAEEALARVISKPDFARMEVLGQFNKGFIIARLRSEMEGKSDDLFIIDQHATDEKFNFETLQRTTVIKAQTLIRPRALQLTAGDELVAMENMEVLKANGFEVKVDEDKAPGRGERISLTAMPVSKETTFDFKDLEQILHLLSDGARPAGQMVRCTKARSMFAMRACRKSVMIGKSLTKSQMTNLIRNMGTIDQPWNCPHGRPTMRHLTKLDGAFGGKSAAGRIDWQRWGAMHDE